MKVFIESSVIADWMLISLETKTMILSEIENYLDEKFKDYKKPVFAYKLLNFIKTKENDFSFYTSDFAISEVLSVIYDKYCIDYMYERNIPLKYWFKIKPSITLPKDNLIKIEEEIKKFEEVFVSTNKINKIENYNVSDVMKLIADKCDTHDAVLLSTAVKKCDFFCTGDGFLIKDVKNFKDMKIMNAKTIYFLIKKEVNKK